MGHLYKTTDAGQFNDIAACQAAADGAKVTIKRDGGGNSGSLSIAFVCVQEPSEE
jgi:hypothetical protein